MSEKRVRVTAWVDVYPPPEATEQQILDAVRWALMTKTDNGIKMDPDTVTIDYEDQDD